MQFDWTDPKFLIKAFFCVSLLFFILGSFQASADSVISGIAVIVAGATIAWAIMEHKPDA
jgi:hypothetical protein